MTPGDVDRICAFLTSIGVRAIPEGGRMVCLSVPGALTSLHELRELSGSIATWNALNPGSRAELIAPE